MDIECGIATPKIPFYQTLFVLYLPFISFTEMKEMIQYSEMTQHFKIDWKDLSRNPNAFTLLQY
jgi:hypothetical protein